MHPHEQPTTPLYQTPEERDRRIRALADSLRSAAEALGFSSSLITEDERYKVSTLALQYAALLYAVVHTDPLPAVDGRTDLSQRESTSGDFDPSIMAHIRDSRDERATHLADCARGEHVWSRVGSSVGRCIWCGTHRPDRPRRVPTVEEMVAHANRNDPDAPKP